MRGIRGNPRRLTTMRESRCDTSVVVASAAPGGITPGRDRMCQFERSCLVEPFGLSMRLLAHDNHCGAAFRRVASVVDAGLVMR